MLWLKRPADRQPRAVHPRGASVTEQPLLQGMGPGGPALLQYNPDEIMLDEEEEYDDSIVSAHSDMNTPPVEPSSDQASDFSASFSDIRILPGSMTVSSDDTSGSPVGKEGNRGDPVELGDGKDLNKTTSKFI